MENEELFRWLEETIKILLTEDVGAIYIAATVNGGNVLTGYYKAQRAERVLMADAILSDLVMETIRVNIDRIKEELEGME